MEKYEKFAKEYSTVARSREEWKVYLNVSIGTIDSYVRRYKTEQTIKRYLSKEAQDQKAKKPIEIRIIEMYIGGKKNLSEIQQETNASMMIVKETIKAGKNLGLIYDTKRETSSEVQVSGRTKKEIISHKQKREIKQMLLDKYPLDIARILGMAPYRLYDVIDSMSDKEKDSITKQRLQKQDYIYETVQEIKHMSMISENNENNGKKVTFLDALRQIEEDETKEIEKKNKENKEPRENEKSKRSERNERNLLQLAEVYYTLGAKNASARILDVVEANTDAENVIQFVRYKREKYKREFLARDIRMAYKKSLKGKEEVSYDKICKKCNSTMSFVESVVGKKERNR